MCEEADIEGGIKAVREIAVAANCTMTHMLLGVDARPIGCAPYKPVFLEGKENILFIDIGTNGEIVLAGKGKILCCSCAAGLALEGMNISSGMRAAEGAVEDAEITEQGIRLKTIRDGKPSKTGAYMTLMSHRARCEMEQLAGKMEYMELAKTKNYERIFTESMVF